MGKNSTSFKKGQTANPKGRKPLSADVRAARNMSYEDMCRAVIRVRSLTPEKIKGMDIEKTALGERAIINAYAKLDYRGIKDYEDRLWGRAQESIDLGIESSGNIEIIIKAKQIEDDNENRD